MDIFFFQAKKKRSKKVVGTLAAVSQAPQRSFGMRENKRLFSHCRDRRPRLFDYGFKQKQNNQPRHCNQPSLKVFCLLFYKKSRSVSPVFKQKNQP